MNFNKTFQNIFAKKEKPAEPKPEKQVAGLVPEDMSPLIRIEQAETRELLNAKLEEYKKRFNHMQAPEVQFDTVYKIAIVEELLKKGEVNTWVLLQELTKKYGTFDKVIFESACSVIKDYVKTGGKNVRRL